MSESDLEDLVESERPVLIVGAGMSGLACALRLHEAGKTVRIFEASDQVGGRVRTDTLDGCLLDRGFQVYLDAYQETGKLLDLDALELKRFEPGALIYRQGQLHRLMDVFRRPKSVLSSAFAPIGSMIDKLRVGVLRTKILASSLERIQSREDQSTEDYLRRFGFSNAIIDQFFRSFYGGIFLENELRTSSRMFEFTFKMFGKGSATVPAKGMGDIPKQLAQRLPIQSVQLERAVAAVDRSSITLSDGEKVLGSAVVVATDSAQAASLLPDLKPIVPGWRSVMNLYFLAEASPVQEPIICLNGEGKGLVNNVCVLTDAAPAYAPEGKSLISVSVLGIQDDAEIEKTVQDELVEWFGLDAKQWKHLRTYRIPHGLPEQLPNAPKRSASDSRINGVYLCGDYRTTASIEGAVISGQQTADAILNR